MPIKNIIPGQRVTNEKQERARELRRKMTPAEKLLWHELRGNKLGVHLAPSALRAPPPNTTIRSLDFREKFPSSYLGEDGWGRGAGD